MKKLWTSSKYKAFQKTKILKSFKKKREIRLGKKNFTGRKIYRTNQIKIADSPIIVAPEDFRLFENTEQCLEFFRKLRNKDFNFSYGTRSIVRISLEHVQFIDYGSISILTSLIDDLKYRNIFTQGLFPKNYQCKKFIIDSGIMNNMVDENKRPFPQASNSELILFEKGKGKLTDEDNRRLSEILKNAVKNLTGKPEHLPAIKTILLEVCGNSIEHAYKKNEHWLLGVKYEENKAIFTVTDVGQGILETLHRKYQKRVEDYFQGKTDLEILQGAFDKKYGSSTKETNRNKGLPAVKKSFEKGILLNLKVLTNNVIYHFNTEAASRTIPSGSPRFRGTFYQWELTAYSILNNKTKK